MSINKQNYIEYENEIYMQRNLMAALRVNAYKAHENEPNNRS